jgi:hypothetical protein
MILTKIFFVNILTLASIRTETIQNDFKVFKNQVVNMTLSESSLISNLYRPLWMQCAAVCNANPNCKTAIYDNS